ncbi:restriction endonuclease [Corynebacterium sp. HMSC058E07]|uniref:restriction endonuclease n=1 Tax=Corynebacterium sp. HMSC058E07 TaxID=1715157 RepID=UPI0008A2C9DB|nr:DEAD/DEAH box helicase family protein [Corynebacterium sp. HMSC058E07]OFM59342.1 restriction endonuclease [Corynebacterium sp. HMSC058E07]
MRFQFDPRQPYQTSAIEAVTDLFDGQPDDVDQLLTRLQYESPNHPMEVSGPDEDTLDLSVDIGAYGNNLALDKATILKNLRRIQDRNGLEINSELVDGLQFDIEMETGTGKTYVYLRTAFELAVKYNFNKYIILVPSVAIREGVKSSIRLMQDHFRYLYPQINMEYRAYSGDRAEDVRDFATATSLQFMVMTIDSIKGDKNTRIIHQCRDGLSGLRPLDYLRATRSIVIMDEPQNMESHLAQSAVSDLDPLCTLRYSATHRKTRNVVYRLDPLDAHRLGLVKRIVVSDALELGSSAKPYVKLLGVKHDPSLKASLELVVRQKNGTYAKKKVNATDGDDLERLSCGNPAYQGNWRINGISVDPNQIELSNYGYLREGEVIGGNQEAVFREMIRETIREHIRKETRVHSHGIKVLSLFFIDKVASYLGEGINNLDANGPFVEAFDSIYEEERAKNEASHKFLSADPVEARSGYFAQMKRGKGKSTKITFKDSSGKTKADDDAYELIMKDKARLLDLAEPVRFIFSHSALREGWDNPNVFQICTLRDMSTEADRRQTIGRGLRLPVNQSGERIKDASTAQLTVVANESYKAFAAALQDEYKSAGVAIGYVRRTEFSALPRVDKSGRETRLGTKRSGEIWDYLLKRGYINPSGEVLDTWVPEQLGFTIDLPEKYEGYEEDVIRIVDGCKIESMVKPKRKRVNRTLNKQVYASPEFEVFWEAITARTTYRVSLDRTDLIRRSIESIRQAPQIDPIRVQVTRTGMTITRGGPKGSELGSRSVVLSDPYPLPDIVSQLQEATSLTRKTIIDILLGSGRIGDFLDNPNEFIRMATQRIETELAHSLIDGIQYEPIGGSVYELRELQADGLEEKDRFIDQLYKVTNKEKTDFDYLVLDSAVEKQFAQYLDGREDIKLFMKLPDKFRVPTPVGDYNPDWAIIKVEDGADHLYLVRETKSSQDPMKRRPSENAKIKAAAKHFEAIGVEYKVSAPERWEV